MANPNTTLSPVSSEDTPQTTLIADQMLTSFVPRIETITRMLMRAADGISGPQPTSVPDHPPERQGIPNLDSARRQLDNALDALYVQAQRFYDR